MIAIIRFANLLKRPRLQPRPSPELFKKLC
jgi:hypothetical protein